MSVNCIIGFLLVFSANFLRKKSSSACKEWENQQGLARANVTYLLNQKKCLYNYLLDGRLESSNNRAERSVKPFVIAMRITERNNILGWTAARRSFSILGLLDGCLFDAYIWSASLTCSSVKQCFDIQHPPISSLDYHLLDNREDYLSA